MTEKPRIYAYKNTFSLGNTEFSVFCDKSFFTETTKKAENVTLHNHFFNEILIIESGEGVFESAKGRIDFKGGNLFYIPKNMPHLFKSSEYDYFSIGFTIKKTTEKNKLFSSYDNFNDIFSKPLILQDKKDLLFLAKEIAKNINKPSTFSYYVIQSLIQKLILEIAEISLPVDNTNNKGLSHIADFDFALNQRINDLTDTSRLKDIAEDFFISERQLSRIIKKQYGVSFIERKNQLKTESAKQLLKNTNLSIDKIAEKACFHDTRTFIMQFTKRVGVSPSKYRSLQEK